MLVCPRCRSENTEEAQFCSNCGGALSAAEAPLRRVDTETRAQTAIEIPAPNRPNPMVAILALVLVAVAIGSFALYLASRPDPCARKFQSVFYDYCIGVPQGWQAAPQLDPQAPNGRLDVLFDGVQGPRVLIRAQVVAPETTSEQYAQVFYSLSQNATSLEPATVGGTAGYAWDEQSQAEDGSSVGVRQVALVQDGLGWRITLQVPGPSPVQLPTGGTPGPEPSPAPPADFTGAVLDMQEMLDSWVWT